MNSNPNPGPTLIPNPNPNQVSKPEGEGAAPTDWPAWAEAELKDVAAYDYALGEVA